MFKTFVFYTVYYSEYITAIGLLFIFSFLFRFLLQFFGQVWISTKAHTATIVLLPIITYVITNVISGNIALSLGMVGALSIVRFRNPVRSPLELSTYFATITMGIAASVSIKWLLLLVFSIIGTIVALIIINLICTKLFKKSIFITSFSEGNVLSTLNIISSEPIEICEENSMLKSKTKSKNEFSYLMASDDFLKLKELENNNEVQKKSNFIDLKK